MTKYFAEMRTVEELRKRYRKLLRKYHPDNENGSTKITQQINQEYDALFAILSEEKKSDGQSYTYEENERFKAILNEIIVFNMTIEVIGSWLWCFDCYSYKDQLKALGFTMCKMNDHLVNEYNSGYVFGEWDICYCEYCRFYNECMEELLSHEIIEL